MQGWEEGTFQVKECREGAGGTEYLSISASVTWCMQDRGHRRLTEQGTATENSVVTNKGFSLSLLNFCGGFTYFT